MYVFNEDGIRRLEALLDANLQPGLESKSMGESIQARAYVGKFVEDELPLVTFAIGTFVVWRLNDDTWEATTQKIQAVNLGALDIDSPDTFYFARKDSHSKHWIASLICPCPDSPPCIEVDQPFPCCSHVKAVQNVTINMGACPGFVYPIHDTPDSGVFTVEAGWDGTSFHFEDTILYPCSGCEPIPFDAYFFSISIYCSNPAIDEWTGECVFDGHILDPSPQVQVLTGCGTLGFAFELQELGVYCGGAFVSVIIPMEVC